MSHEQAVLDITQAIAFCGFYALVCFSFGVSILRLLHLSPLQGMALSGAGYLGGAFFVGQGLFGAIWQTVATFGCFSTRVVLSILVIVLLTGAVYFPPIFRLALNRFYVVVQETKNLGLFWMTVALMLMVLIGIFAYLTLSPPRGDALAYYLAQAKLFAGTGRLYSLPEFEYFSPFGVNAEMHAATLYLLAGDVAGEYAAKICTWITALAGSAMLWAISSRVGLGRRGQWMVTLMLYTTTGFTFVIWDGKTDLFGTGLGLAAIYWVLQISKIKDWVALFLSGLMVGFAVNSKFSLLVVMAPMLTVLAFWGLWTDTFQDSFQRDVSVRKQKWQRLFFGSLIAGGAFVMAFLPLFFKNGMLFGEPLAVPFSIIHSEIWQERVSLMLGQVWYSPENTRWIVGTYPFALTFGQYPMQYGNLTPLLLAFLPLFFFLPKNLSPFRNQSLMALTLSSVVGVVAWVVVCPSVLAPRYILPPLLTLLPLGGYIVERLWKNLEKTFLKLSVIIISFFMVLETIIKLHSFLLPAKAYWKDSARTYQAPIWKTLRLINTKAARGDVVYLAMWYRLYLRLDLLQCLISAPHPNPLLRTQKKKWDAFLNKNMWEELYNQGASWLVLDRSTHGKLFKDLDPNLKPNFLSILSYPIDDRFIVYQIVPKAGAPKPTQRSCPVVP